MKNVTIPDAFEDIRDYETVGKRLSFIRRKRNLKQEELAERIDVKRGTIAMYEKDSRNIPSNILIKITEELKVSADFILGLSNEENYNVQNREITQKTGLNAKVIKILEKYNNEYGKYGKELLDTINFLIEQENPFPADSFSVTTTNEKYIQKEFEEAEEKALKKYEEYEELWDKCHSSIISMIDSYFKTKIENEKITITYKPLEQYFDNELENGLIPKEIISNETIVDNVYLSKIEKKLRNAKIRYLRKEKKQNKK